MVVLCACVCVFVCKGTLMEHGQPQSWWGRGEVAETAGEEQPPHALGEGERANRAFSR